MDFKYARLLKSVKTAEKCQKSGKDCYVCVVDAMHKKQYQVLCYAVLTHLIHHNLSLKISPVLQKNFY